MTDIPESIKQLSDTELRKELKNVGINAGPLTPTTRRLFQSKLAKKRGVLLTVVKNLKDFDTVAKDNQTGSDNKENEVEGKQKENKKAECYYGVFMPPNSGVTQENDENVEPMVFESKSSALLLMKKHKNARFKVFSTFEDARNYSLNVKNSVKETDKEKNSLESENPKVDGESINFASLKQEDLNHFMLFLEKGDVINARRLIWENPRYLVTSADSPVILKASTRYNALHVAAKHNQPEVCCEVLFIVENPEFYKLLYPNVTDASVIEQRMEHILDLYLNTPERGLFETPLHIASKFGFKKVISELLVYTQCCKTMKNKFGDTPADIVCSRASDENKRFKSEIAGLLNDHYFVPLLRDFDNFEQPIVGEPWDAKECSTNMGLLSPRANPHSPIGSTSFSLKPKRWLSALAGPMSKEKATEMRNIWKTPSKLNKVGRKWSNLKKTDPEKGEEHVGRYLASQEGAGLLEFWGFIDDYADFSQVDGLRKLEDYLLSKCMYPRSTESFDEISELTREFGKIHINSETDIRLNTESSQEMDTLKSNDIIITNNESPKEPNINDGKDTQEKNYLAPSKEDLVKNLFIEENETVNVVDSLDNLTNLFSKKIDLKNEKNRAKERPPLSTLATEKSYQEEIKIDPYKYRDLDESVSDVFSSPSSSSYSSSNLGSISHPGYMFSFLSGNMPTKLDRDVLLAIGDTHVPPQEYPCIHQWKKSVLEFSACEREKWGTPRRTTKSSTFLRDATSSSSILTPSTPRQNMRRFFCRTPSTPH